jgi:hypothetical protein
MEENLQQNHAEIIYLEQNQLKNTFTHPNSINSSKPSIDYSSHVDQDKFAAQKNVEYLVLRKRNNEAAKKCRDSRKNLEKEMLMRVIFLERENTRLEAQVKMLLNELGELQKKCIQL